MRFRRGILAVTICLLCFTIPSLFLGSVAAKNRPIRTPIRTVATAKASAKSAVLEQLKQVRNYRKAINFYRSATWNSQDKVRLPRTPTSYSERRIASPGYLRWSAKLWHDRWQTLKVYIHNHPWVRLVQRTYRYRQCIITVESRTSGLYHAQNSKSTASGAYQFLDTTWVGVVSKFEEYYHRRITTAKRAIDAPSKVQDAIAAYAIVAQHGRAWTECRSLPRLADT